MEKVQKMYANVYRGNLCPTPTRRARIEAEAQARRSQYRRSLTMGAIGLTTVVGATVAGMGPAAANEGAYSAPSGSTANSCTWEGGTAAETSRSSRVNTHSSATSSEPAQDIQWASYSTASSSSTGWGRPCSGLRPRLPIRASVTSGVETARPATTAPTSFRTRSRRPTLSCL